MIEGRVWHLSLLQYLVVTLPFFHLDRLAETSDPLRLRRTFIRCESVLTGKQKGLPVFFGVQPRDFFTPTRYHS